MQRKEISKGTYVSMCWTIIAIGLLINAIFSTWRIFTGFNYYKATYMAIGTLVIGFGVGLAYARSWKIKGID